MHCNTHDCRFNNDGYCELIDYIAINSIPIYCDNYEPNLTEIKPKNIHDICVINQILKDKE